MDEDFDPGDTWIVVKVPYWVRDVTLRPTPNTFDVSFVDFSLGRGRTAKQVAYWGNIFGNVEPLNETRPSYRVRGLAFDRTTYEISVAPEKSLGSYENLRKYTVHLDRARPPKHCSVDDVWCTTLTVGRESTPDYDTLGYWPGGGLGDADSLDRKVFVYGDREIEVTQLFYDTQEGTSALRFAIEPLTGFAPLGGVLRGDDFRLYVGPKSFAIENASAFQPTLLIPDHGLSWEDGEKVRVRLVRMGGVRG